MSRGDAAAPAQREPRGLEVRTPGFCPCSATSACSLGKSFRGAGGRAVPFRRGAEVLGLQTPCSPALRGFDCVSKLS